MKDSRGFTEELAVKTAPTGTGYRHGLRVGRPASSAAMPRPTHDAEDNSLWERSRPRASTRNAGRVGMKDLLGLTEKLTVKTAPTGTGYRHGLRVGRPASSTAMADLRMMPRTTPTGTGYRHGLRVGRPASSAAIARSTHDAEDNSLRERSRPRVSTGDAGGVGVKDSLGFTERLAVKAAPTGTGYRHGLRVGRPVSSAAMPRSTHDVEDNSLWERSRPRAFDSLRAAPRDGQAPTRRGSGLDREWLGCSGEASI